MIILYQSRLVSKLTSTSTPAFICNSPGEIVCALASKRNAYWNRAINGWHLLYHWWNLYLFDIDFEPESNTYVCNVYVKCTRTTIAHTCCPTTADDVNCLTLYVEKTTSKCAMMNNTKTRFRAKEKVSRDVVQSNAQCGSPKPKHCCINLQLAAVSSSQ